MIVLGIETSCDETSVAIVEKKKKEAFGSILNEQTLSQILKHQPFGGVVPELSFREHSNSLDSLVKKALKRSQINIDDIDAFASTFGPGLLGGLVVGSNYAKAMSMVCNKPFLAINHLQAHVLISRMKKKINFPFLCLLVSGGHTQILIAENYKKFVLLGETLDDALGEAFDKTAKLLGLKYPGGPEIEKIAKKSRNNIKFDLPHPLIEKDNFDFSFSGLKTSIRRIVLNGLKKKNIPDLANEFQQTITRCLCNKLEKAIDFFKKTNNAGTVLITGGVASNNYIRNEIKNLCNKKGMEFHAPDHNLCVDNATMIAWTGIEKLINGERGSELTSLPKPRWSLEDL